MRVCVCSTCITVCDGGVGVVGIHCVAHPAVDVHVVFDDVVVVGVAVVDDANVGVVAVMIGGVMRMTVGVVGVGV